MEGTQTQGLSNFLQNVIAQQISEIAPAVDIIGEDEDYICYPIVQTRTYQYSSNFINVRIQYNSKTVEIPEGKEVTVTDLGCYNLDDMTDLVERLVKRDVVSTLDVTRDIGVFTHWYNAQGKQLKLSDCKSIIFNYNSALTSRKCDDEDAWFIDFAANKKSLDGRIQGFYKSVFEPQVDYLLCSITITISPES